MKQIHYLCKEISYSRRHKSFEVDTGRKEETSKWLADELGVSPSSLKITDLLKIDIKEIIVREYDAFLREKMKKEKGDYEH